MTLSKCAEVLAAGGRSAEALARECLDRIGHPAGEGARAFISVDPQSVLARARESDARRGAGQCRSAFDGVPISIKDLFDVEGEVTRAGSIILRDAPAATVDAPAIARLRAAGFVLVGRTNMTEFAYGGHGINAHYGTPLNPWDRASQRIPGGSTSGGAVSVTDGMAMATIGSDTGGSVRMPAALCGLVGIKPTQARVPLDGAFPLSFTRDSIGPLGHSVTCCVALDQIMAGHRLAVPVAPPISSLRFGVPRNRVFDGLAPEVAEATERALRAIRNAGAQVEEFDFTALDDEAASTTRANFSAVEAYALHRDRLATRYADFDPMVAKRLMLGANILAADYVELVQHRTHLIRVANAQTEQFDALLMPTMAIIAPRIAEMRESDEAFYRINALLMRNVAPFNVLDRPSITLPSHRPGEAPVGLQLVGGSNQDDRLHAIAFALERVVDAARGHA